MCVNERNWGVLAFRVSKVIQDFVGFTSLFSAIGPENSRHSLNQSDAKLNPSRLGRFSFPA